MAFNFDLIGPALVNGVALGSLYSLFALSVVLVFRTTGVGNFASGAMATFLAFLVFRVFINGWGLPVSVGILCGLVAGGVLGLLIYVVVIAPRPGFGAMNLTFRCIGLFLLLSAVTIRLWSRGEPFSAPALTPAGGFSFGSLTLSYDQLGVLGVASLACALMFLIIGRSNLGLIMRAVASNRPAANLIGVNIRLVEGAAWVLAGVSAAVVGCLFAPITLLSTDMMNGFLVTGFTAAILGGIFSFPGAVLGGLLLGVSTSISSIYTDPDWQAIISLIVLVAVLLWRPQGIFGARIRNERV